MPKTEKGMFELFRIADEEKKLAKRKQQAASTLYDSRYLVAMDAIKRLNEVAGLAGRPEMILSDKGKAKPSGGIGTSVGGGIKQSKPAKGGKSGQRLKKVEIIEHQDALLKKLPKEGMGIRAITDLLGLPEVSARVIVRKLIKSKRLMKQGENKATVYVAK